MKKLIILMLLSIIPALGHAGEWLKMWSQDNATNYVYSDIQNEYGNHLVWIKVTYDTVEKRREMMNKYHAKAHVFEVKMLYAYNSEWSKQSLKTISTYGKSGNVLTSFNYPYDEWNYITPGTIGEGWRDAARTIYENGMQ